MNLKKIGAEFILGAMVLPWAIWITAGIVASQKADAVQESKLDIMIEMLKEVKVDLKEIKHGQ